MRLSHVISPALALIATCGMASADVLLLDSIARQPPNSATGLPRPANQMTRDMVRATYGEPSEMVPAVGDPPISRWIYPDFTVYFEYERVLTSVVHR
jgi:hypothetical protein